jgi:hypothetical protein
MLLLLAGFLAFGMWLAPRYLFELRSSSSPAAAVDADPLPVSVAVPEPVPEEASPVPPAERSRDVLPLHFAPQSADALFGELRDDGTPANVNLAPWDKVLLGRLLAIDEVTADRTAHYETDYLGLLLAFAAESLLDPLAKGPQADDRGLGQVGYWAEEVGRRWASDNQSLYYFPGFDPARSIWEPETNILLATALMRWVYTTPEIHDPLTAYAVYTRGHVALLGNGRLEAEAQVRFNRAESYRQRMLNMFRLKLGIGPEPEDDLIRGILGVDRAHPDGRQTYRALRDLYVDYINAPQDIYTAVLLAEEALLFSDLLKDIYGEPEVGEYQRLLDSVRKLGPSIQTTQAAHAGVVYGRVITRLESRLAQ